MPITSVHQEYQSRLARWKRNRAAVIGQDAIKDGATAYLPDDNASSTDPADRDRYDRFLDRATWMPVTGYTRDGLVGAVFRKPATVEMPDAMQYLMEDCDGAGRSLEQFGKAVVGELLTVGRGGILAEYPAADEGLSAEQVTALGLRPKMTYYATEAIDHWRYTFEGGKLRLTMVKLQEVEEVAKDEFTVEVEQRFRVLRLNSDGVYEQVLYDEYEKEVERIIPRQANGSPWLHIPFHFAGAEVNEPAPGEALLSGIVDLNIKHYQLDADYSKNLHIHSGGLLVVSSKLSTDEWVEANPQGVTVGADKGLFLGEGGSATILQLSAADATAQAMKDIEQRMVAVGARLIQSGGQNETAEAARIQASTEASALSNLVGNASEAIEAALEDCARFEGVYPDQVFFALNQDFWDQTLTAQDIMAVIQLGDRGIIAKSDQRHLLRQASWIDQNRTDEDIENDAETQVTLGL